jgi:hypothetical protein
MRLRRILNPHSPLFFDMIHLDNLFIGEYPKCKI